MPTLYSGFWKVSQLYSQHTTQTLEIQQQQKRSCKRNLKQISWAKATGSRVTAQLHQQEREKVPPLKSSAKALQAWQHTWTTKRDTTNTPTPQHTTYNTSCPAKQNMYSSQHTDPSRCLQAYYNNQMQPTASITPNTTLQINRVIATHKNNLLAPLGLLVRGNSMIEPNCFKETTTMVRLMPIDGGGGPFLKTCLLVYATVIYLFIFFLVSLFILLFVFC